MLGSLFEFFEVIAEELTTDASRVITSADLQVTDEESPLMEELKRSMERGNSADAILRAVEALSQHFRSKNSRLPFGYDRRTGTFTARDAKFLEFVKEMSAIRSIGTRSKEFECVVAKWLGNRVTGSIHRVGYPRERKTKVADFNAHMLNLGFGPRVLQGREKDGGLDIIWLLPVGSIPHRPIVSIQCKNGEFNIDTADGSVGAGSRSLSMHAGLQPAVHVPCVLFNDYIYPAMLTQKQMNFVPLGLTDLASMAPRISVEMI